MAKTYTAAGSATAGDVYTASAHNVIVTDVNNFIVPPMVCAVKTTASPQSIANSTSTSVTFTQTDEYDTDDMHSTSVNTSRLTITTPGVYQVSCVIDWAFNATGRRFIELIKNGAGFAPIVRNEVGVSGGGYCTHSLTFPVSLALNDYVEISAFQSSGGALNISEARFAAVWIGRTS